MRLISAFLTNYQVFNYRVSYYFCISGEFGQNEDAQLWNQRIDSQAGASPSICVLNRHHQLMKKPYDLKTTLRKRTTLKERDRHSSHVVASAGKGCHEEHLAHF